MNNYLHLLSTDLICTVLEKVADIYDKEVLCIEKKINKIQNKIGLYHNNKRLYRIWFSFYG